MNLRCIHKVWSDEEQEYICNLDMQGNKCPFDIDDSDCEDFEN